MIQMITINFQHLLRVNDVPGTSWYFESINPMFLTNIMRKTLTFTGAEILYFHGLLSRLLEKPEYT